MTFVALPKTHNTKSFKIVLNSNFVNVCESVVWQLMIIFFFKIYWRKISLAYISSKNIENNKKWITMPGTTLVAQKYIKPEFSDVWKNLGFEKGVSQFFWQLYHPKNSKQAGGFYRLHGFCVFEEFRLLQNLPCASWKISDLRSQMEDTFVTLQTLSLLNKAVKLFEAFRKFVYFVVKLAQFEDMETSYKITLQRL